MKKYLITGLLIWIPLAITIWVLELIVSTMDQSLLLLPPEYQPQVLLGYQIPGLGALNPYLLTTQYFAWHGLLRTPTDWAPIGHSAWVCALYGLPALVAAYLVFLRRDVAGG